MHDFKSLLRNWGWSLVAYLLIGALWFWPWYVTWVAPLAALRGPGRLRTTVVLYSIGGMILYGLYPLLAPPFGDLEGYAPLICFGPVALYLLRCTFSDLREKSTPGGHATCGCPRMACPSLSLPTHKAEPVSDRIKKHPGADLSNRHQP